MVKVFQTTIILLFVFSYPVFADLKIDIATCAEKKDSVKRLDCFDSVADKSGLIRKATTTKTKSKWIVQEESSKIDDSKTVILFLKANVKITGQFHEKVYPSMILRCENNKTNAYITTGLFLGTDSIKVTSRLDKNKAHKKRWSISTDNKAMFVRKPIGFIKKLMKHSTLLVEFIPYNDNRKLVEFDVSGLENDIKALKDACHW